MGSPLQTFSIRKADGTLKTPQELQADVKRITAEAKTRADTLRDDLAANVVEASSRNQAATVVVNATGALQAVRLSDRTKSMSPAQVSAAVMEAYGEATRQAVARTQQLANERFGESRFATRLADFLPQPEPEEETR